jgi:hypothetical protein
LILSLIDWFFFLFLIRSCCSSWRTWVVGLGRFAATGCAASPGPQSGASASRRRAEVTRRRATGRAGDDESRGGERWGKTDKL